MSIRHAPSVPRRPPVAASSEPALKALPRPPTAPALPPPRASATTTLASAPTTTKAAAPSDGGFTESVTHDATAGATAGPASTSTSSPRPLWQDDEYVAHMPTPLPVAGRVDSLLDRVAPIRTHERVIADAGSSVFGLQVGFTVSQLDLVRKNTTGVEVVQVVNRDGSGNLETILGRKQLGAGQRIEFQGPALNTSLSPGELPVGARFVGIGLTSDVTSAMDHDALSYTIEVKLTEKTIADLAALGGPGAAQLAADALVDVAGSGVGAVVGDLLVGAVPVLSATLAIASARRAYHVVRDPTAPVEMKAFQVAHAVADAVRVVFPLAGTIANAALVGVAVGLGWVHMRHAKHAPPIGPPDGGTLPSPPSTP